MPPAEEDGKMERLRRLDHSVTKAGTAVSVIVGIISTLIFGVGMCCTMVWECGNLPSFFPSFRRKTALKSVILTCFRFVAETILHRPKYG